MERTIRILGYETQLAGGSVTIPCDRLGNPRTA
jgi:hypothetical protein